MSLFTLSGKATYTKIRNSCSGAFISKHSFYLNGHSIATPSISVPGVTIKGGSKGIGENNRA